MKRLYPLLFISVLIYWGCEDKTDDNTPEMVDDTPTEVTLWGVVYSVEDTDTLDLHGNNLTGEIPPEIGNLTNLVSLNLSGNQLTGEIPSEIGQLTNLESLALNSNQLTGEIPPEIGNLTNLINLYLSENQLTGEIPVEICNQGDSTPSVGDNQLCPPYPSCISQSDIDSQDTSNCP